jgi:hypothetical protein
VRAPLSVAKGPEAGDGLGHLCARKSNFDAAARRVPCLNLLALVVSGNYLLLYLLKICGVIHFM